MTVKMRFLAGLMFASLAMSGCVHTRAYIAERERVDQDIPGIPPPEKPKTRQVIVVEMTEKDAGAAAVSPENKVKPTEAESVALAKKDVAVISPETTVTAPAPQALTEYKVEKDDTLQKISKKFYGSYSKWTRIYDVNKDVIKNPNFVKPGTVLKIPAAQ